MAETKASCTPCIQADLAGCSNKGKVSSIPENRTMVLKQFIFRVTLYFLNDMLFSTVSHTNNYETHLIKSQVQVDPFYILSATYN